MTHPVASDAYVDACAAQFRARVAAQRAAAAHRAAELRVRAQAAARKLVEDCGARRVWLFGSLAWGEAHGASDMDLLVEGLTADAWSAASALVEEEAGTAVDLVLAQEAAPELLARVSSEGVLLHAAR